MRTTLELPDDLMRAVKVRAAQHGITLTEAFSELLRSGLSASERPEQGARRVQFPLVRTGQATEEADLSADRIADILSSSEADALIR
ncbi:MAG: hypothetical protein ACTHZ9_13375 [Leucobacter sp.]